MDKAISLFEYFGGYAGTMPQKQLASGADPLNNGFNPIHTSKSCAKGGHGCQRKS
jgi:hypothetical protein